MVLERLSFQSHSNKTQTGMQTKATQLKTQIWVHLKFSNLIFDKNVKKKNNNLQNISWREKTSSINGAGKYGC